MSPEDAESNTVEVTTADGSFYNGYKKGTADFLAFVREVGQQGLSSGVLDEQDTAEVSRGLDVLNSKSDDLFRLLGKIVDEGRPTFWDECTVEAIWQLFGGVFLVAQHAGISTSAERYLAGKQSAPARAAKAEMYQKRSLQLSEAIVAEAAELKRSLAVSTTFGDAVRPGVRKRLGVVGTSQDGWPSSETIKDAVRRMRGQKGKTASVTLS